MERVRIFVPAIRAGRSLLQHAGGSGGNDDVVSERPERRTVHRLDIDARRDDRRRRTALLPDVERTLVPFLAGVRRSGLAELARLGFGNA